jgi:hypothetical protein
MSWAIYLSELNCSKHLIFCCDVPLKFYGGEQCQQLKFYCTCSEKKKDTHLAVHTHHASTRTDTTSHILPHAHTPPHPLKDYQKQLGKKERLLEKRTFTDCQDKPRVFWFADCLPAVIFFLFGLVTGNHSPLQLLESIFSFEVQVTLVILKVLGWIQTSP